MGRPTRVAGSLSITVKKSETSSTRDSDENINFWLEVNVEEDEENDEFVVKIEPLKSYSEVEVRK